MPCILVLDLPELDCGSQSPTSRSASDLYGWTETPDEDADSGDDLPEYGNTERAESPLGPRPGAGDVALRLWSREEKCRRRNMKGLVVVADY